MNLEVRLQELELTLPEPPKPQGWRPSTGWLLPGRRWDRWIESHG